LPLFCAVFFLFLLISWVETSERSAFKRSWRKHVYLYILPSPQLFKSKCLRKYLFFICLANINLQTWHHQLIGWIWKQYPLTSSRKLNKATKFE
jgi:hypothetical protein